ncbi:thioredoxin family protein [uncultured Paraglaciecola sp.]|uniref:thioredoxin family protein n=1 Tax=uncultured Paraglaciecola sp. TaxID=1765024 RepID=UPI0030D771FB|tara:strand:+ start:137171 stop:137767 length:597 start_codon:yes stop_codon:yes gene_type:complete
MATITSNMLALGHKAANFSLPDTQGNIVSLADFEGSKGLVVAFICNHCPYVIHIAPQLAKLAQEYQMKGIAFVAINSNDTEQYPEDNMAHMIEEKLKRRYPFPYLLDESQEVAKSYAAACTPDLYLFDGQQKLVYRGQFDDSRPTRISSGNYDSSKHQATGSDLILAMDTLLDEGQIDANQTPSMGCNIKWRDDNQPY